MTRDWESTFRGWMGSASDTEKAKREHAESMVRDAIAKDKALAARNIRVRAQGSYRNSTNVPQDSDVDIYVCCLDVFYSDFNFADRYDRTDAGIVDASLTYSEFKAEVGASLVAQFGSSGVSRGSKAFDVHANSYRVDADVVATFEHRRYQQRQGSTYPYISGTEFRPDDGGQIINWPEQQYDNGVTKNKATGGRFKGVTRILKELRYEMADAGIGAAGPIASYLIECLAWNASPSAFGHDRVVDDVREVLAQTFNATLNDQDCKEWGEVNDLKYLFSIGQSWSREQAHTFLSAAWNYVGFS
jgi:hypothetical protein